MVGVVPPLTASRGVRVHLPRDDDGNGVTRTQTACDEALPRLGLGDGAPDQQRQQRGDREPGDENGGEPDVHGPSSRPCDRAGDPHGL